MALDEAVRSGRIKRGDVLLLDVGASYANYNADLTRTLPVSGRFTRRQKAVYNAVLRALELLGLAEREMQDLRGNGMAMVFQEPMSSLNPAFTIGDQLLWGAAEPLRRMLRILLDA